MFGQKENKIDCLANLFLKAFIISIVFLLFAALVVIYSSDQVMGIVNSLYGIDKQTAKLVMVLTLAMFKNLSFILFFIPFLALKWTACKCKKK